MKKTLLFSALVLSTVLHAAPSPAEPDSAMPEPAPEPDKAAAVKTEGESYISPDELSTPAPNMTVQPGRLPNMPAAIRFSDLTKNWRRFTLDKDDSGQSIFTRNYGPVGGQILQEIGIGVHFTKGDSFAIGKENFLVTYRVDPGIEPRELQQEIQTRMQAAWGHNQQNTTSQSAGKFSPYTVLRLALVSLRNAGDIRDIRTFDPARDMLSQADLRATSMANLTSLGNYFQQFIVSAEAQGRVLPLGNAQAVRQMLQNNFHAPTGIVRDPFTGQPYRLNTALNGKSPQHIYNKKDLPIAFEAQPSTDGKRGVLFLDGHAERVPETQWKAILARTPRGPSAADWRRQSNARLKTLGQLVIQFASYGYNNGKLPMARSNNQAGLVLRPYFGRSMNAYQVPRTRKNYLYNRSISLLVYGSITNKKNLVSVYENGPSEDGTVGAVFLDGTVRRIPQAKWKQVLATKPVMRKPARQERVQKSKVPADY